VTQNSNTKVKQNDLRQEVNNELSFEQGAKGLEHVARDRE